MRLALALIGSVVGHLLLVAWLHSRPRQAPSLPTRPIEVALVEVSRPPTQTPPSPPPQALKSESPRPRRPTATPQPAPAQVAPVPKAEELRAQVPPPDSPLAQPPAPRPDASRFLPRADLALEQDGPSDFAVTLEQAPRGLRAPEVPQDLAQHIAREAIGEAKVKRGLVHPYYSELGKALLKHWDADRAVSRRGLKGFGEQFEENGKQFNRLWMERAAAFGASGSPLEEAVDAPREPERMPSQVDANLARRQAVRKQVRQDFRATRRATLRVVQDQEGRLLLAQLVSPSRDAQVDREALADVRAAVERLPAPPPEARGGRTELVSLWLFELVVSINPPIPTFSFEFDEALGYIDPRLPLDRRIYKRVRLLSVE